MSRLRAGGREARTLGWRPWWCSPPVPPTSPRTPPPRTAHGSLASSLHIPTLKPQLGSNLGFLSNFSMWLVSVGALWCNCGASIVQAHGIGREVVNEGDNEDCNTEEFLGEQVRKYETADFHPVSSMFFISHSKKRFSISNAQRMPELSRKCGKKFNYCPKWWNGRVCHSFRKGEWASIVVYICKIMLKCVEVYILLLQLSTTDLYNFLIRHQSSQISYQYMWSITPTYNILKITFGKYFYAKVLESLNFPSIVNTSRITAKLVSRL